jgi:hypothetical protein
MRIPIGLAKQEVLARLGKPYHDGKCGDLFGGALNNDCEELIYANAFAPIVPQYVGIRIVGNKVFQIVPYVSP